MFPSLHTSKHIKSRTSDMPVWYSFPVHLLPTDRRPRKRSRPQPQSSSSRTKSGIKRHTPRFTQGAFKWEIHRPSNPPSHRTSKAAFQQASEQTLSLVDSNGHINPPNTHSDLGVVGQHLETIDDYYFSYLVSISYQVLLSSSTG